MYNEYHDYPLVATAECFVWCIKWQSFNFTRCRPIYIRAASPCSLVVLPRRLWYFTKRRSEMAIFIRFY